MKPQEDIPSPVLHLERQLLLLRMEYEYEKEEFRRQTESMGVARKVKRGLCWYPVTVGRHYYNSLNQLVLEVTRTEDTDIEHAFEFGRPVVFFRQDYDGKITYYNTQASVSYADDTRLVLVMPGMGAVLELQAADRLGVQLFFDETSYRTMFEALADVLRAKGNRLAELRDTLLGTSKATFRELYPVRFPWLNTAQEEAVNRVLCARDVAVVHGPPGTHGCRLDIGEACRPRCQCLAYRKSHAGERQDAFLYLRASFRVTSRLFRTMGFAQGVACSLQPFPPQQLRRT